MYNKYLIWFGLLNLLFPSHNKEMMFEVVSPRGTFLWECRLLSGIAINHEMLSVLSGGPVTLETFYSISDPSDVRIHFFPGSKVSYANAT